MVQHLVANKNIDVYMRLIADFLKAWCAKYIKVAGQSDPVEADKAFSQVTRALNVVVQLSEPSYPKAMMDKLYEFSCAADRATDADVQDAAHHQADQAAPDAGAVQVAHPHLRGPGLGRPPLRRRRRRSAVKSRRSSTRSS